jgi:hypothetical protein
MVLVGMPVRSGVTVRRAVAAPDVAARHAQPQVIPPGADAQTVLAALTRGHHLVDQFEMATGGFHGASPFGAVEILVRPIAVLVAVPALVGKEFDLLGRASDRADGVVVAGPTDEARARE